MKSNKANEAKKIYDLMSELFYFNRSLTGDGNRKTLDVLKREIPIKIKSVKTASKVFDWEIPKEWNIREAYIENNKGQRVIDFGINNLHVIGYSTPINAYLTLDELLPRLISIPDKPDWIPYVTSYYKDNWGFCIEHNKKINLPKGIYHVVIDSSLVDGVMNYGELIIKGLTDNEVLLSTYICHPSMSNNELSGPVVLTYLAKWLMSLASKKYTYRIIFIPETIGSIYYINKHYKWLRDKVIAGYVLTTIGDSGLFSFVESRYGDAVSDCIVETVFKRHGKFLRYSFLERGSDERQYNSPGVDLGITTVTRSKFGTYPEYHTSADNMNLIKPVDLYASFEMVKEIILETEKIENAEPYHVFKIRQTNPGYARVCIPCEPQLSKRGLYPTLSTKDSSNCTKKMMNFLSYADGTNSIEDIARYGDMSVEDVEYYINLFKRAGVIDFEI